MKPHEAHAKTRARRGSEHDEYDTAARLGFRIEDFLACLRSGNQSPQRRVTVIIHQMHHRSPLETRLLSAVNQPMSEARYLHTARTVDHGGTNQLLLRLEAILDYSDALREVFGARCNPRPSPGGCRDPGPTTLAAAVILFWTRTALPTGDSISDSDRGLHSDAPDELELPRPAEFSIGEAYMRQSIVSFRIRSNQYGSHISLNDQYGASEAGLLIRLQQ
ncbi:hypothetical protein J7T55_011665 [Diaporthe amygdali]|uniref:uncharacterized protein n=1 Tax=Phomopsis amygdali TaxID=1214568 RepID=UPI0022FDFBD7|nr:uncharacterized protein J7T55_011665 [Diaporthe amygdali]KAJ0123201.1 hypothetical protein J7T55_011665 [Diaporthe amygdali]